jgi:hypothetical protein
MAVRKPCRNKGCKTSPRCDHPWWLDVTHKGVRYRMPVDDFAFARGATAPVSSKQEAEKVWEPKFIAEMASGKAPRVVPDRKAPSDGPATARYRTRVPSGIWARSAWLATRLRPKRSDTSHQLMSAPPTASMRERLPWVKPATRRRNGGKA